MNFTIRPMTPVEHKYGYTESSQLMAATGCIGCLRGSMDSDGQGFSTSWDGHRLGPEAGDFRADLNAVIDALRFDAAYGGVLADKARLSAYCRAHPDSGMGRYRREYGFRADTDKYTYMLRLNPNCGEDDLYACCYVRERMDRHMKEAEQGIRFIDASGKDLFRLADGDRVCIEDADGGRDDRLCRFIDEAHMECGGTLYHILDFAKEMEKAGNTVIPLRSSLPEKCFAVRESFGKIILIHRGFRGWRYTGIHPEGMSAQEGADMLNVQFCVTKAQAAAMLAGSMFGGACPGADPANYDEQGRPRRPGEKQA